MWSQSYSVSGTIKDDKNIPVAYTNILLLTAQDSSLVSGATSDDRGVYSFENVAKGSYVLKVSFIGYKGGFANVSVEDKDVTVQDIILKEDVEALDAVEVIAKRPTIKVQADRLVFNVENTALTEGSIMQVLRNTPRVLVVDGAITIKNAPATVYINDRRVNLTGQELAELLEGSPADAIQSIDVITNPSARYDADSQTVLNIVMSKNLITGYRGSVSANYTQGVFPRTNYGLTQYYKNSKINIFANYNYAKNKINRDDDIEINFLNSGGILEQRRSETFDRTTNNETHNYNVNIDYNINDANTLRFSAIGQVLPYSERETIGNSAITDNNNNALFSFNSNNINRDERYNLGFDLDYIHDFKNSSRLTLNAHYTDYDYERRQDVNSEYFSAVGTLDSITAFNTFSEQDTEFLIYKADYVLPIGDYSSFEAGIKISDIESSSSIVQNDIINGQEVPDGMNTDNFIYDENIYAAYINYQDTWGKWSFTGGLRFEDTNIEGNSVLLGAVNTQDYSEFFPTVNLLYQVSDKLNVYTNYRRSVQRPNYQSLNPFRFFLNDNTIVTGNPALQPIFSDRVTLGTSFFDAFTFEVVYNESDDNIIEIPLQDNLNNLIVATPTNVGTTREISFDFEAYFDITSRWSIYLINSTYNTEEESVFDVGSGQGITSLQRVRQDLWSNISYVSNDFSLLKDNSLNINFTLTYGAANLQGFQVVSPRLISDLAVSKRVFKGKGILSLAVSDLFNDQDFTTTRRFLNQDNNNFSDFDNRTIRFGFRYRFGNTRLETNERTKEFEELDRLQRSN